MAKNAKVLMEYQKTETSTWRIRVMAENAQTIVIKRSR